MMGVKVGEISKGHLCRCVCVFFKSYASAVTLAGGGYFNFKWLKGILLYTHGY